MLNAQSTVEVQRLGLSVITWNVWFDEFKKKERYDEILAICKSAAADVICLQEVTPYFIKRIREHEIARIYDVSDPELNGSSVGSYGVLTMCRRELNASFQWYDLPTDMGRRLLTTNCDSHAGSLCIGNVHLESLNNAPTRLAQLQVCHNVMNRTNLSVLCGDFNFDSDRNFRNDGRPLENNILTSVMPLFKDVWLQLHPLCSGKTYDTEVNLMLQGKEERMRYDRIMMRNEPIRRSTEVLSPSTDGCFVAADVSLLGTAPLGCNLLPACEVINRTDSVASDERAATRSDEPCVLDAFSTPEKKGRPIFPSDHFGLHAVFIFST